MAWQIYELTNSPLQLGLLGLARGAPMLVLLLFGGMLADATNRRHLLMVTQIAQMCVSAGLVLLTISGRISAPILYVASLFLALFSSLEQLVRTAIIPNIVPRGDLPNALALSGTQRHVANIVGPHWQDSFSRNAVRLYVTWSMRCPGWRCSPRWLACGRSIRQPGGVAQFHEGAAQRRRIRLGASGDSRDYGVGFRTNLFWQRPRSDARVCARHSRRRAPRSRATLHRKFGRSDRHGRGDECAQAGAETGAWVLVGVSIYGLFTTLFGISHFFGCPF